MTTLGVLCAIFVVPPQKLPPALQGVDAFKPLATAVLLAWLPVSVLFLLLASLVAGNGMSALFLTVHSLIAIFAYFGVLMITAPDAYEELKKLFAGGGAPRRQPQPYSPAPGGFPPAQASGYPPPAGPQAG